MAKDEELTDKKPAKEFTTKVIKGITGDPVSVVVNPDGKPVRHFIAGASPELAASQLAAAQNEHRQQPVRKQVVPE